MILEQLTRDGDRLVRQYERDDQTGIAVDFGSASDGSVDVVDGTVIVVHGDDQHEFDLPADADAQAFIRNGVLTIELTQEETR